MIKYIITIKHDENEELSIEKVIRSKNEKRTESDIVRLLDFQLAEVLDFITKTSGKSICLSSNTPEAHKMAKAFIRNKSE